MRVIHMCILFAATFPDASFSADGSDILEKWNSYAECLEEHASENVRSTDVERLLERCEGERTTYINAYPDEDRASVEAQLLRMQRSAEGALQKEERGGE